MVLTPLMVSGKGNMSTLNVPDLFMLFGSMPSSYSSSYGALAPGATFSAQAAHGAPMCQL